METGQWRRIEFGVIDTQGRFARYSVKGKQASNAALRLLRDKLKAAGATFIGGRSLDVFQTV